MLYNTVYMKISNALPVLSHIPNHCYLTTAQDINTPHNARLHIK